MVLKVHRLAGWRNLRDAGKQLPRKWRENEKMKRKCRANEKWKGNGGRMRQWRDSENEERERFPPSPCLSRHCNSIFSFSLSLSISSCSLHFLSIWSSLWQNPATYWGKGSHGNVCDRKWIHYWSALWTNYSKIEEMADGTCIIQMRHASIQRMNQEQWGAFKKRRLN